MLDTVHAVHTPEGVDLNLRAAGPVARSFAWAVDTLLRAALLGALSMMLLALGRLGMGLMMLATFAIWWFYPVVFEVNSRGQTPGKRALGLAVVHEDGTPIGWGASILRNFLRVVDFLPAFYLVGLASMLLDPSFRRLGDLAAGTLVVYTDAPRSAAGDVPQAAPLAPPVALDLEEQRAVIAFAERAPFLTPERAAELAAIPLPLHGEGSAETRLVRMAAWLVGRRR